MNKKLDTSFYLREDVLQISKDLLGKVLVTNIDGEITSGIITETEAYMAPEDKASHAYGNKKTARTEVFYMEGAIAYVYVCYGIHNLFNVITNQKDKPHAILIRSIEPLEGIEIMMKRRNKHTLNKTITSGPGSVSKALGINKLHNKLSLTGNTVWIEDRNIIVEFIHATKRVGIDYAEEYKDKPWRFYIDGTKWVSKV
ncbi:DNA-3-methyladenine glycosylase [uncultured Cytophaga sp.]|uniref:DNA-3-methyladenine glycosylase n=1 Tax=uncultured Cytophaga sp. TaxID=160238 RepID=UPI002615108F|nr:DNA-3-methyladenine glycosylase [uncultured Cytophaga sp.]